MGEAITWCSRAHLRFQSEAVDAGEAKRVAVEHAKAAQKEATAAKSPAHVCSVKLLLKTGNLAIVRSNPPISKPQIAIG